MMPTDPVQQEYADLAPRYDRRWSFYVEATIRETMSRVELKPHDRVLDLGCGTGSLIRSMLDRVPEVDIVGLDPSAEMLRVARAKLSDAVELVTGSADSLPFPNESFDVVISTSAFHYFRQPTMVIQEAKRILKPNGRLIITDWCVDYLTCRILDIYLRLVNRAHFRTYGIVECRRMLEGEGLREVRVEGYKINWFWGMMTATAIR
jgi:ubiquinone/menaquinone biosynthesis C-methylase UbiE